MDEDSKKPDSPSASEQGAKVSGKDSEKRNPMEGYYADLPQENGGFSCSRIRQPRRVLWSIAWSDLMMTMFILFAVLYIYQAANRDILFGKQVEVVAGPESVAEAVFTSQVETLVESVDAPASRLRGEETNTVRLRHLSDIGTVELTPDKAVRIILPGDLLFDTGQAELKHSSIEILRQVADAIRITEYRVNVVGHTDSVPMHSKKFATNWELSAIRACAVARFLIEQMDLSPVRFYVSGYAYLQPVAPNDSPSNRAANRRVELVLTKNRPAAENG